VGINAGPCAGQLDFSPGPCCPRLHRSLTSARTYETRGFTGWVPAAHAAGQDRAPPPTGSAAPPVGQQHIEPLIADIATTAGPTGHCTSSPGRLRHIAAGVSGAAIIDRLGRSLMWQALRTTEQEGRRHEHKPGLRPLPRRAGRPGHRVDAAGAVQRLRGAGNLRPPRCDQPPSRHHARGHPNITPQGARGREHGMAQPEDHTTAGGPDRPVPIGRCSRQSGLFAAAGRQLAAWCGESTTPAVPLPVLSSARLTVRTYREILPVARTNRTNKLAIHCGTRRETRCPPTASGGYKAGTFLSCTPNSPADPSPESVRASHGCSITLTRPADRPQRVPVGDRVALPPRIDRRTLPPSPPRG
jgi:hypothetical protein